MVTAQPQVQTEAQTETPLAPPLAPNVLPGQAVWGVQADILRATLRDELGPGHSTSTLMGPNSRAQSLVGSQEGAPPGSGRSSQVQMSLQQLLPGGFGGVCGDLVGGLSGCRSWW